MYVNISISIQKRGKNARMIDKVAKKQRRTLPNQLRIVLNCTEYTFIGIVR